MRVLVCGSRDWKKRGPIQLVLRGMIVEIDTVVIHGAAPGADSIAHMVAEELRFDCDPYPADWDTHGKKAGPIRNQQMLDEGKPDVVFAFVTRPLAESRGTADMVRRAKKAGVPVYVTERM